MASPCAADACVIEVGFEDSCAFKSVGGNQKRIWITPLCNISSVTVGVDNVVDSFTMVVGTVFYEVTCRKDTLTVTQTMTPPNGFYTQTITGTISPFSNNANRTLAAQEAADFVNALTNINGEPMVVIIESRNDVRLVYGLYRGVEPTASEFASGTVIADASGYNFTLTGSEDTFAPALDAAYTIPV